MDVDMFKPIIAINMHEAWNKHIAGSHQKENDLTALVQELKKTNAELREARRAALNLMEDAILSKEALHKSEEKYRTLFDSIDEGFVFFELIYDEKDRVTDHRYLEVNRVFERQTGLKEAAGKLMSQVAYTEPSWLEIYDKVVRTGEPVRFENYSEATGRWYSSYTSRVGKPGSRQLITIFDDITERKLREKQQEYLLKLSDAIRSEDDLIAIEEVVTKLALAHFASDRCYYCTVEDGNILVHRDAKQGNIPSAIGKYPLNSFPIYGKVLDAGRPLVVHDVSTTGLLDQPLREICIGLNIISFINVPVIKNGKPAGIFCLVQSSPRKWTKTEIGLAEETAERTWTAVERARVEEALQKSEARLRTLADAVPQVMWSNDESGKANYFNQRWYEYSGLDYRQSAGLGWEAIVHPDDAPASVDRWHAALAVGEIFDTEYRLRRHDGKYLWHIGRNIPLKDEGGNILGWFGTATNIDDLKQVQEQLHNTSSRLELALAAGRFGSYEYDFTTGEIIATAQHKKNFGFGVNEPYSFEQQKQRIVAGDRQKMEKELDEAIHEHKPYSTEYRVNVSAHEVKWIRSVGHMVYDGKGEVQKLVGITLDITAQKAFTEELSRKVAERTAELKRSNEDLRQFAHVASHDLKEPVRKIKIFNGRLLHDYAALLPGTALSYLEKIRSSSDRMTSMIEGVLQYAKVDAGELHPARLDLYDMIGQITADLELMMEEKQATVKTGSLPAVKGNGLLIYQLFYNLILNALKFAKKDTPDLVEISGSTIEENGKKFHKIEVSDNGIGFDPQFEETIFKTFTRLHPAEEYEGTGLGLALCKKIVARHQGSISASGELNKGAVFTILLPA